MAKSPDAFRTISEVADWLGVQAHVLRFWESKFSQVKPVKRAGGRRYYRPADMQLLGGIKKLLHDEGMTIKGVQKLLREHGIAHVADLSQGLDAEAEQETLAADTVIDMDAAKVIPMAEAKRPEDASKDEAAEVAADAAQPAPETESEPAAQIGMDLEPAPDAGPEKAPQDEQAPRPLVVDLPEIAADADMTATPGPLALLSGLDRLTADQARAIAPVADELRGWLQRSRDIGPA